MFYKNLLKPLKGTMQSGNSVCIYTSSKYLRKIAMSRNVSIGIL